MCRHRDIHENVMFLRFSFLLLSKYIYMFEINYWILVSSSQYYQSKGQIFFSIFHLNLFIYLFWDT